MLRLSLVLPIAVLLTGEAQSAGPAKPRAPATRRVEISVTENGFEPTPIKVKKDEALTLVVTRKTKVTCATSLVLDEAKLNVELPLDKPVEIPFTPTKTGQVKYGCSMGKMIAGVLIVE
jgi:plastocyanin domain-containing protein